MGITILSALAAPERLSTFFADLTLILFGVYSVNFSVYAIFYPEIEKFEKETRTTATSWAGAEEKKFKQFFLNKLSELDEAIKQKIAEQEAALKDKAKTEEMIAENKRNLSWLDNFKAKLDGILSI